MIKALIMRGDIFLKKNFRGSYIATIQTLPAMFGQLTIPKKLIRQNH